MTKPLSSGQLTALQSLYAKWQAHAVQDRGDPRAARLAWASENAGRTVTSFKELTADEARRLIDVLKVSMGQKLTREANPWRRIEERRAAREAGTAGRKNVRAGVIQLASPDDLARVAEAVGRLGWTEERFQEWLRSSRSPLHSAGAPLIRTVADANRVWWALKAMLARSGAWKPPPSKRRAQHPAAEGLCAQRVTG